MISVGDARKGLGLGFRGGGGGREMEENELEEGEASSYRNDNDNYDASIDPDIAFSYIGEKLQNVLGHFQKDFEGGVSAENLGAKYGGYGSFLPAYQRSPVCSHPRTPPTVQNNSTARSPNNPPSEGGHQSSLVSSSASQSVKPRPASTSSTSLPALKTPSMKESVKQDIGTPCTLPEEVTPRYESENKIFTNLSDQKTLKVRLKVSSDSLSTIKNAEIYSGLGLDVSPSSSLNESPSESEGMSVEPQDMPFESPTTILEIMTSFLVPEDLLISPLSHDLIHLTEKEKLMKDFTPMSVSRGGLEITNMVRSDSKKVGGEVIGKKKMKSLKHNDVSAESKSGNGKDVRKGNGFISRKEPDIDLLACEESVSKTLKLPLLSNSSSAAGYMEKGGDRAFDVVREANKGLPKDKKFSDLAKDDSLGPTFTQENGWFEKSKARLAGKARVDKRTSSLDDVPPYPKNSAHPNRETSYDSVKSDSNVSKGRKALNTEFTDPFKEKTIKKDTVHEQDNMRLRPEKEDSFSGSKKILKGIQSNAAQSPEVPKVSLRVGSSSVHKTKSSTHAEELKMQKDLGRTGNRYGDFFGELEEEQNQTDSLEGLSGDKDFTVVEKSTSAMNKASDKRSSVEKFDKPSISEAYPKAVSNVGPCLGNGPISDSVPATGGAPSTIEPDDTWVLCDRCHKWRLLPFGRNPKELPEKWLCSMLDWLPEMNRCSVTEEETTNALIALYKIPAPESQTNLPGNPGGVFANVRHPDQNDQNIGLHARAWGEKKKDGSKEIAYASPNGGLSQLPNSMNKSLQASVKGRSLNDLNQSPLMGEPDFHQPSKSKSSDLPVKKNKEKLQVCDNYSDGGGDAKSLKVKSRKDNSDQDFSRASKKLKTDVTHEHGMLDHSGHIGKMGPSSSNGFHTTSEKKPSRYIEYSSFKDSRNDACDALHVSVKKENSKVLVSLDDGSLEMGNTDATENSKTRKVKEFSDDDYRKEKKARVSKSEGKEPRSNRDSGRRDKKSSHVKNQHLGKDPGSKLSQQSLDGLNSLRKDLGSLQPSTAATSSSSKVSGSHKTRVSLQEVKGSPVESVSSSPMRISNPDKVASACRDLKGKDELQDGAPFPVGSPRKCSDGEDDDRGVRSGTARRDKALSVAYHRSVGSPGLDIRGKDFHHTSGSKARAPIVPSSDITNQCHAEERQTDSSCARESCSRKSGKGSSSRLKEKSRSIKTEVDMGKVKIPESLNNLQDQSPSNEVKLRDDKNQLQQKLGIKYDGSEKKSDARKDTAGKSSSESSKRECHLNFGEHDGSHIKMDSICREDAVSTTKQTVLRDCDSERSSKRFPSDKTDQVGQVSGRGKSLPFPPSGGSQVETVNRCPRPVTGSYSGNGVYSPAVVAPEGDAALKVQKQVRKADSQNGTQHISSRHPTSNGQKARELDSPSPARRDSSSSAATNALKEAKDLKHWADRLKNSGSNLESTGFYFQAALKFLSGASLLESGNCESSRNSEMNKSKLVYSSTAKLCEFCAHEYEKLKNMAAAALAYKCMEVAYMRVIYFSHTRASRDHSELQNSLQMVPPGESPSSSASDLDNLNNPTTLDKVTLSKGVNSPQVTGNHVIAAQSRPNFTRLLSFAQDVNFAMEASRKSRIAFAAASVSLSETKYGESISSIKRALDFNFQDVDGLLRLVRLAMEEISH